MNASETRNGGEISGSRAIKETKRLPGTVVRVTAYARTPPTATVISVETAETTRQVTSIRASRQELKHAAYWPRPSGPATLMPSTRATGHTTKTSSSASTAAAVTPRAGSTRASRVSGGAGARATVAIAQPAVK